MWQFWLDFSFCKRRINDKSTPKYTMRWSRTRIWATDCLCVSARMCFEYLNTFQPLYGITNINFYHSTGQICGRVRDWDVQVGTAWSSYACCCSLELCSLVAEFLKPMNVNKKIYYERKKCGCFFLRNERK